MIVQTPENVAIHRPNQGDDNQQQENQEQRAETPKNDEEHEYNSSENVLREIHNLEQENAAESNNRSLENIERQRRKRRQADIKDWKPEQNKQRRGSGLSYLGKRKLNDV
ncbi:unnamed protein product [Acanthoscelides obtectus]|uniref:Uncharacterized protein n=1 Tax=Acanthoscelides obtectus TaxID=200917 RepID=A0A9P0P3M5_ACAOB|nr:unnamed protein product [Acanthoscelides obtectus]CAK1633230.1 hypothetical protein AOBTE_LOCUS7997 [Acanthoscelides obtectus]